MEKGEIAHFEPFHLFFHNVFNAIWTLKSCTSHISVVVCSFFEFGIVSKLCMRKLLKLQSASFNMTYLRKMPTESRICSFSHDVLWPTEGRFYGLTSMSLILQMLCTGQNFVLLRGWFLWHTACLTKNVSNGLIKREFYTFEKKYRPMSACAVRFTMLHMKQLSSKKTFSVWQDSCQLAHCRGV